MRLYFFLALGSAFALISCADATAPKAAPSTSPTTPTMGARDAGSAAGDAVDAGDEITLHLVSRSASVHVEVERALYRSSRSPRFFMHVRITNDTDRRLGVDLRNRFNVVYPNQWSASDHPRRDAIDERRLAPSVADAGADDGANAAFASGALKALAAHATVDYFIDFNAGGAALVDTQTASHPYVLVSMDGVIRTTDGKTPERTNVIPVGGDLDVVIPAPIVWKEIPSGALFVGDAP